jgi:small-conductance mechanosensitive channel
MQAANTASKALRAAALAVLLAIGVATIEADAQIAASPAPAPAAAVAAPAAIPSAEVIAKSSEVANLLTTLAEKFAPSAEIRKIEQSLPEVTKQIDLEFTDTSITLGEQPPLTTIQVEQVAWQHRHLQVSTWLTLLTQRAVDLRAAYEILSRTAEVWTQTLGAGRAEQAPEAVLHQVTTTLTAIEAAQAQFKSMEDDVLGLQGSLAAELSRCDEILAQIGKAQKSAVAGILNRENPAVWSPELWDKARAALPGRLLGIARGFGTNIVEYLRDPVRGLPLHAALFAVLAAATVAARRKKRRWTSRGIGVSSALNVFDRPFSAAAMAVLWAASSAASPAPARVKDLLLAIVLVPVIRLLRPMVDPRMMPGILAAVVLYGIDIVRRSLGGAPLVEQVLLALESGAAIAALAWLLKYEPLIKDSPGQVPAILRTRAAPILMKILVGALGLGGVASILGFTRLARLVTPALLTAGILALILFVAVRVTAGALAIALQAPLLQRLQMVRKHADLLQLRAGRLLKWIAALIWARRFLDHTGLLDPVVSLANTVLDAKLERGAVSISVEDVLAFGVALWAAYLLSGLIRFTLKEEVYPRRGVSRGMSYAYSRLVHYIVMAIGFLFGLGVLGLELSKISVLAGAFGVGIGFGLQDVVNNFVCGLILLFERPVHAGDIVEVGGVQGEVRRIGIRASTIRTYQGAEIVVPNSQFITASVTNWTLSDPLRRIELPVGVNYGAPPQKVIDLLESIACAHPAILKEPAPKCLFMGYGDSSINFELRAWTEQFDNWGAIRSELATAVYDAVYSAGLSFPFPQREVRVVEGTATVESRGPADDRAAKPSIVPESDPSGMFRGPSSSFNQLTKGKVI